MKVYKSAHYIRYHNLYKKLFGVIKKLYGNNIYNQIIISLTDYNIKLYSSLIQFKFMKKTHVLTSLALVFCLLLSITSWAQNDNDKSKRPSPPATVSGKVGDATVSVNYSSPSIKGRKVWGELVPYGQVWRAGANEATTIEFSNDVMVEGKPLKAGKYSLYTLPGEDEWTVIFNKVPDQWGTVYDEKQDALRVNVQPVKSAAMNEQLAYAVNDDGIVLRWENLEVPVTIK